MPQRLPALPPALFDVLAGVDLLLHAGDVGELWVLDELSRIAPVIAVHGNDDTADAQRELPYQQAVVGSGRRILLTHAHYPDRAEEMESRTDDKWEPKLTRRAAMAKRAGAAIVVFGHTHIPMAVAYDGVLCVNPGAIASGNFVSRQRVQTVAVLTLAPDTSPIVRHVDLTAPNEPFVPQFDLAAGFHAALDHVSAPLVAADLAPDVPRLIQIAQRLGAAEATQAIYLRLLTRGKSGAREVVSRADLRDEIAQAEIREDVRREFLAVLGGH